MLEYEFWIATASASLLSPSIQPTSPPTWVSELVTDPIAYESLMSERSIHPIRPPTSALPVIDPSEYELEITLFS